MSRYGVRSIFVHFAAVPIVSASVSFCQSLHVRNAQVQGKEITVYLEIEEKSGKAVYDLKPGQITAILGAQKMPITEVKKIGEKEGIAYVLLVSIAPSFRSTSSKTKIRYILRDWIDEIKESDRTVVMYSGPVVEPVFADRRTLKYMADSLKLEYRSANLQNDLERAIKIGRRIDPNLPGRRVVIVLSDSRLLSSSEMGENLLSIYVVELFGREENSFWLDKVLQAEEIEKTFAQLQRRLRGVWELKLECEACETETATKFLQIKVAMGLQVITDKIKLQPHLIEKPPQAEAGPGGTPEAGLTSERKPRSLSENTVNIAADSSLSVFDIVFLKARKNIFIAAVVFLALVTMFGLLYLLWPRRKASKKHK